MKLTLTADEWALCQQLHLKLKDKGFNAQAVDAYVVLRGLNEFLLNESWQNDMLRFRKVKEKNNPFDKEKAQFNRELERLLSYGREQQINKRRSRINSKFAPDSERFILPETRDKPEDNQNIS